MYELLYNNWGENIITVNPDGHNGNDIPIIMQIKYFITKIDQLNGIKLTKAGNLPSNIVKDIYNKKIILDEAIETGITKLTKEADVDNITAMKHICIIAGLIKKRNNIITLNKKTLKEMESPVFIEKLLYNIFFRFNWAYFDFFENERIGQFGINYSLYLLNKYGNNWEDMEFYAKLYFKAFSELLGKGDEDFNNECYMHRIFHHIFNYCGFIEFENSKLGNGRIKGTNIFKKYIKIGMYVA
jgi:hypothetical protein